MIFSFHAWAGTLTVQTAKVGVTPDVIGYDSGHFYPGGNTRDWWRYAGVSGVRMFISASTIEPSDDVAPVGDGVNSAASFLARRAAIRTNQFNPAYINWAVFTNNYANTDLGSANHIKVDYALGELRKLKVRICAQITGTSTRFPIASNTDWANMWEYWQHYYAQAFYLGRTYDVDHYENYNEPNLNTPLTPETYLLRLQLASDAIQEAIADVNTLYGKNLTATMLAPTLAGNAYSAYSDWGGTVVSNRHVNFLGQTNAGYSILQKYDYHQYGSAPSAFGSDLVTLQGLLTAAMFPEPRSPTAITEFNTHTGASFDTLSTTLDSNTEYPRFGSICVNLLQNGISEFYAFKFSQTEGAAGYVNPVAKNAMHYVDNTNAPYNIGGITKAGEVYRQFAKAFGVGRDLLGVTKASAVNWLDVSASYDAVRRCYYLYSVNYSNATASLGVDLTAWNIPALNQILVQEVSDACYGGSVLWTNLLGGPTINYSQSPYSVLLFTVPAGPQDSERIVVASDDAGVRDGANKNVNYAGAASMIVRNDPASADNRQAAFVKFHLPTNNFAGLRFAELSLPAACATSSTTVQAHVYALTNTSWSQNTITWSSAPNLKQNVAAGNRIASGFVAGIGTNASIVGQEVTSSTTMSEKLIDVTDYLRAVTNADLTFMVSQDPRWDVTLPSLAAGDAQADGIKINTTESGNGPRLRLVFDQSPKITALGYRLDVPVSGEAFIQGGVSAGTDIDEAALNYLLVKYSAPALDSSRKVYFQFNLAGLILDTNAVATLTVNFVNTFQHDVQLWGLNQDYAGLNAHITWNTAQANNTAANDLLTSGPFFATALGSHIILPVSSTAPYTFNIPTLVPFVQNNHATFVVAPVTNAVNNAGGLRMQRLTTTLNVRVLNPMPPSITGIGNNTNGSITIGFTGGPGQAYRVQTATNLNAPNWIDVSTNIASTNGIWTFTDLGITNRPLRFYRATAP